MTVGWRHLDRAWIRLVVCSPLLEQRNGLGVIEAPSLAPPFRRCGVSSRRRGAMVVARCTHQAPETELGEGVRGWAPRVTALEACYRPWSRGACLHSDLRFPRPRNASPTLAPGSNVMCGNVLCFPKRRGIQS